MKDLSLTINCDLSVFD